MKIYYYSVFTIKTYDLVLSFLPLYKAKRGTVATLTTLKQTTEMSPTAWPLQPKPANRTSFSSINFKQSSLGTKTVIFWGAIFDQLDPDTHLRGAYFIHLGKCQVKSCSTMMRTLDMGWINECEFGVCHFLVAKPTECLINLFELSFSENGNSNTYWEDKIKHKKNYCAVLCTKKKTNSSSCKELLKYCHK